MLFNCAQDKAVQYLSEVFDQVANMGEILQFIVVELIRKVCRTNPQDRVSFSNQSYIRISIWFRMISEQNDPFCFRFQLTN